MGNCKKPEITFQVRLKIARNFCFAKQIAAISPRKSQVFTETISESALYRVTESSDKW